MTALEIYETMRRAGFPPVVAVTMTAISLRESGGNPAAFNDNAATGDRSYGLLQINMKDANVAKLIKERVLSSAGDEKELLEPVTNARAGFLLWGGQNHNLDIAWYINRPGIYRDRYESHLPAAQNAALASVLTPNPPPEKIT